MMLRRSFRRRRRSAPPPLLLAVALPLLLIGCAAPAQSNTPREGWRTIDVGGSATFQVPPGARNTGAHGIDSAAGVLRGNGYEVVYDHGPFGERLESYENQPEHVARDRQVSGRPAVEVSFRADGRPLPYSRVLQVQDDAETLTVHVSCRDADACAAVAAPIFDSVAFS